MKRNKPLGEALHKRENKVARSLKMQGSQLAFKKRYSARFILPAVLVLVIVVCGLVLGLRSAGNNVDKMSSTGQTYEAYRAIGRSIDDLSLAQQTVGTCSDCIKAVNGEQPDHEWLRRNIAKPMFDVYKARETYIFDGADRPIFAAIAGKRRSSATYSAIHADLDPFIARVRGRTEETSNYNERLPGSPLPQESLVRTTPRTVHSTDLILVRGRPAIVSVMRMAAPANAPLIANIRYMDAAYLAELGRQNFLQQARIVPSDATQPGEQAVALNSSRGQKLGYFVWKPLKPGSMLISSLLPYSLGAVAVLTLALGLLGWRSWRLMRRDYERVQQLETTHTELRASEAQTHHLAYHDVLTGLPNRAHFTSIADIAMERVRQGERAAVLLLDLDRFKMVNDRFGHLAGDALIQEVARRLSRIVECKNGVARLGGDEFAIVIDDAEMVENIEPVLERILNDLRQPFDVLGNQAFVGVSIGLALAPDSGTDRSDLMRKADIALYRAKAEGRDCYRFFTDTMDDTVQLRSTLEADLRNALTTREGLSVHYQPQLDPNDESVMGLEALVRWAHPTRGQISPEIFVPIAEETGLMRTLDDWVLEEACSVATQWPHLSMAINLSPVQFRDAGFAEHVEKLVIKAGVQPQQIELEVTEGVLLDDDEVVKASLRGLRKRGFRIALDDFGTGYSSLSYLRKFEVDKIKIDKSFVKHLGESNDAAPIITAVVTLGHAMGLRVTAEGVETAKQRRFLAAAGCNELQGFLYSKAVPETQLTGLIDRLTKAKSAAA